MIASLFKPCFPLCLDVTIPGIIEQMGLTFHLYNDNDIIAIQSFEGIFDSYSASSGFNLSYNWFV